MKLKKSCTHLQKVWLLTLIHWLSFRRFYSFYGSGTFIFVNFYIYMNWSIHLQIHLLHSWDKLWLLGLIWNLSFLYDDILITIKATENRAQHQTLNLLPPSEESQVLCRLLSGSAPAFWGQPALGIFTHVVYYLMMNLTLSRLLGIIDDMEIFLYPSSDFPPPNNLFSEPRVFLITTVLGFMKRWKQGHL